VVIVYSWPSVLDFVCASTGVCFSASSIWERRPAEGEVSSISKDSVKEAGLRRSRDWEWVLRRGEDVASVGGSEVAMFACCVLVLVLNSPCSLDPCSFSQVVVSVVDSPLAKDREMSQPVQ
jgi:hypothetical protein